MVAQSVEQGTENPCVGGSIPPLGIVYLKPLFIKKPLYFKKIKILKNKQPKNNNLFFFIILYLQKQEIFLLYKEAKNKKKEKLCKKIAQNRNSIKPFY